MGGADGVGGPQPADRSPFFGTHACFSHSAVELPLSTWWKFASPELAADSFLADADEKRLAVVHKPLAVVTHGCGISSTSRSWPPQPRDGNATVICTCSRCPVVAT